MPPDASGDAPPKGGDDAPPPVDDTHMALLVDGIHDFMRDILLMEQHGVVFPIVEQGGIDKSWSDVGETDFQLACVGLLFQCLQVCILKGFCGGVGGGGTKSHRPCYGGDDVSALYACHHEAYHCK